MEQTTYFEDCETGSTRETFGRTITETEFVVHAGHAGDFLPHHMDAGSMKASGFGQRIAHGTMAFSIGVGLTATVVNPVASGRAPRSSRRRTIRSGRRWSG